MRSIIRATRAGRAIAIAPRLLLALAALALLANPARASHTRLADADTAEYVGGGDRSTEGAGPDGWVAEVVRPVPARTRPSADAPVKLMINPYMEESGAVTGLMATAAHRDADGRTWIRVQLPVRPNASSAWVRGDAVVLRPAPLRIEVLTKSRRLEVWRGRRRIASYRAGIGTAGTPTPTGRFAIWDSWDTPPEARAAYGSRVLELTAHSNVLTRFGGGEGRIAIHSGSRAQKVGGALSHGCIIVSEAALRRLSRMVAAGTPVIVMAR